MQGCFFPPKLKQVCCHCSIFLLFHFKDVLLCNFCFCSLHMTSHGTKGTFSIFSRRNAVCVWPFLYVFICRKCDKDTIQSMVLVNIRAEVAHITRSDVQFCCFLFFHKEKKHNCLPQNVISNYKHYPISQLISSKNNKTMTGINKMLFIYAVIQDL